MGRFKLITVLASAALVTGAVGSASGTQRAAGAGFQLAAAPAASALASTVPTVLAVTPDEGTTFGGTKVTITGEGFHGATTVNFGETPVTLKEPSKSQTTIKVAAPPGRGTVDITVTSPEATSATSPADQYTYVISPPIIAKMSPLQGPARGGTAVKIGGEYFTGATAVYFGTQSVPFTVKSRKVIKAIAPTATSIGTVDVTVTTPEGTSAIVPADQYTYTAEFPAVETLSPGSGPATGGTTVMVGGEGFIGASRVTFEHVEALSFSVINDTEIEAVAPPGTVRKVPVQVKTPQGTSPELCAGNLCKPIPKYQYVHPTVESVEPKSGPVAGGTPIAIAGTGFATGPEEMLIQIGSAYAKSVHCTSINYCTAVTSAITKPGAHPVLVRMRTNVNEASEPNPEATFDYE
jgi:hypothetical protein